MLLYVYAHAKHTYLFIKGILFFHIPLFVPFLHLRIQNSCNKRQKCKKGQKCIFNFEIHTEKATIKNNKTHFFCFYIHEKRQKKAKK